MKYKAVIFDLDGTLVNSIEDIADAMNMVLKTHNYPTHSYNNYKTLVGSGIKALVINALPKNERTEPLIETCFNDMMDIYKNLCTVKTKPYDGIIDLLNILKSKQLKLSILSNKADALTKKVVTEIFPGDFSPILGLKSEATKKPNPVVTLEICKSFDILPEETIFIGDTGIDIQTANNAKMLAVGVSWGFRNKKELIEHGAKHILNHPLDLIPLL